MDDDEKTWWLALAGVIALGVACVLLVRWLG